MSTMPEALTKAETIQRNLILNRNALIQQEIDERFLQRAILKEPRLSTELAQVQLKMRHTKDVISYLEEIEKE